jgi:archaellum component FlaC
MSSSAPVKRSEHAADEAGGEVIYSSDGLDPLPVTKPPPLLARNQHTELDSLDTDESLRMEDALEMIAASTARRRQHDESPRQRLERLERELQHVAQEISVDDALQQQVAQLQAQLALQTQRLQAPRVIDATASSSADSSADLEQLLARLERAIGSMDAPDHRKGLLERLSLLERTVEQLDATHLERVAQQAKVLRQDLQAASKAKSKLSSGSSSNTQDDVKKISELYSAYNELSSLSSQLPIVAQRLQALSQQHTTASLWNQQLSACEQLLQRLQEQWKSTSDAVTRVESQWATIQSQLQEQVQGLDERWKQVQEQL